MYGWFGGIPHGSMLKNPTAMQGTQDTQVQSMGWKDPLEEEMATHSSIRAWKIPWTEEPGGLQSTQRVRHNWATEHVVDLQCCINFSCTAQLYWRLLNCSVHPHTGLFDSVPLCLLANPPILEMMQMGGSWVVKGRQCLHLSPDTAALLCLLFPEQFHRWPWVAAGMSVLWSPLLLGGTCPQNTQKELIRHKMVREESWV